MKSQKGVSMIELVVVLIIIILITGFSIYSGKESAEQATAMEVYTEINAIREAVNSINIKKDLNEDFVLTSGEHYDLKVSEVKATEEEFEAEYGLTIKDGDFENLYIIYGMDELVEYNKSKVKDSYGFDSIKHTYLVNFEEVDVELLKGIKISNRKVRTFEQVRALLEDAQL